MRGERGREGGGSEKKDRPWRHEDSLISFKYRPEY